MYTSKRRVVAIFIRRRAVPLPRCSIDVAVLACKALKFEIVGILSCAVARGKVHLGSIEHIGKLYREIVRHHAVAFYVYV